MKARPTVFLRDILLLTGALSITAMSLRYLSFEVTGVLNLQHEDIVNSLLYRIAFYIHIIGGMIALTLGPLQFWSKFRKRRLIWHRRIGRIYIYSIAVSGMVGLPVVYFAHGGAIAVMGFLMLDLLWLSTTYLGLLAVLKKNIAQHMIWMERSYAVTFAAVTLRIIIGIGGLLGFAFTPGYQFAAWACWIINLGVLESVRRWRRKKIVVSTLLDLKTAD